MIAAIDADLRKHYAIRSDGVVLFSGVGAFEAAAFDGCDTVLYEIASALDYTDNKAIAHNKRRWTIWNVATATSLWHAIGTRLLVSPSHVWTKGYNLAQRHALAQCLAKKKDVRECEAMLFFYAHDSRPWVPFKTYLDTL